VIHYECRIPRNVLAPIPCKSACISIKCSTSRKTNNDFDSVSLEDVVRSCMGKIKIKGKDDQTHRRAPDSLAHELLLSAVKRDVSSHPAMKVRNLTTSASYTQPGNKKLGCAIQPSLPFAAEIATDLLASK